MPRHPCTPVIVANETIETAFATAINYIVRTRNITDMTTAQEFLAGALAQLLHRGERHPIRLANLAIAEYERAHAAGVEQPRDRRLSA